MCVYDSLLERISKDRTVNERNSFSNKNCNLSFHFENVALRFRST